MSDLRCEIADGVAVITLDRPEVKNAINGEIMDGLADAAATLQHRDDVHAVIVTGTGQEAFCAGGDLKWLQRYDTGERGEEMSRRMQANLMALSDLPMPVIGAINGYAFGGGAELAMACDMRVMESHTFLCFKQVQVGIMTGWTGGVRLLGLVGYARAMEFVLTCPKIHAERALALGLANAVVPTGDGMAEARKMASRIGRGAPRSIRAMKALLKSAQELDVEAAAEAEANLFRTIWASEDHNEALDAFFNKRRPEFKGR